MLGEALEMTGDKAGALAAYHTAAELLPAMSPSGAYVAAGTTRSNRV
jgi:hypothetical protein